MVTTNTIVQLQNIPRHNFHIIQTVEIVMASKKRWSLRKLLFNVKIFHVTIFMLFEPLKLLWPQKKKKKTMVTTNIIIQRQNIPRHNFHVI